MAITGGHSIAIQLRHHGVDRVFGVLGDGNLETVSKFVGEGGSYVAARHETGAVAMADGYARATGGLGVATSTLGPGFTNTITALVSSRKGHSPVVLLAGDVHSDPNLIRSLTEVQRIDQARLAEASGLRWMRLSRNTWYSGVQEALEMALGTSSPVIVLVPKDLQYDGVDPIQVGDRLCEMPVMDRAHDQAQEGQDSNEDIAEAVARIRACRRPLILAGHGAVRSHAKPALIALSRRLPALVGTTLRAKDMFAGEAGNLDIVGGYSSQLTRRLIKESDCVLSFGASLNDHTTDEGNLVGSQRLIIRCDTKSGLPPLGVTDHEVSILGDARKVAEAISCRLSSQAVSDEQWVLTAQEELSQHDPSTEYERSHSKEGLDPRWLTRHIDTLTPNKCLVVDSGHFSGFPNVYMHVRAPEDYFFAHDFGAVGLGLGTAIGVAMARPNDLVVLAIGDGGLMMSLPDLDTAVRQRANILVLVLNDSGYGAEAHRLRMTGTPEDVATFENPSFEELAKSMGARSITANKPSDLNGIGSELRTMNGPLLIDARVDPDIRSRTMEALFKQRLS